MRRYAPALLTFLIGGLLSAIVFHNARTHEDEDLRQGFERQADEHAIVLRQHLIGALEPLHAVTGLFEASEEVTPDEFRTFTGEMLRRHPEMQALEWIPRVRHDHRAAYEAAARRAGHPGFRFTERAAQGEMVAAATRDTYYPVYFVEPLAGNEAAFGFDLGSEPMRLAALHQARDSAEVVATARITLVQETGTQYGFLAFHPVYRDGVPPPDADARRARLEGFGLAVFKIGGIVDAALPPAARQARNVEVFLFDLSAPAGEQMLHADADGVRGRDDLGSPLCVDRPFELGTRQWLIAVCPAAGHPVETMDWSPLARPYRQSSGILAVGLLLAGMLAFYVRAVMARKEASDQEARKLRRSEARYRDVVDNAHLLIQAVDPNEGRFTFVNRAWLDVLGYARDEVAGLTVADVVHPDSMEHWMNISRDAMSGPAAPKMDAKFVGKDQRVIEVEGNVICHPGGDGTMETHAIFNDVTARNRAGRDLEALARERDQVAADLTRLIDTANAPIFGVDKRGRIDEWNQAAARVTGYDKQDVLHCSLVDEFIAEDDKAAVKEVLDRALEGHETANFEFPFDTRYGTRAQILLNATARRDAAGNIVGVIGVGQDITEIRRQQVQLVQAQKMEAVGQLTGGLAHDFNNLLTVIQGNLRMLIGDIGDAMDEDTRELVEDALSAAHDGGELTHQLLAFSRQQSLDPKRIDVNQLLADFGRLLRRSLGENIELRIQPGAEASVTHADPGQLQNALLNLAINARDAMQGDGVLTIRTGIRSIDPEAARRLPDLEPGDYVEIRVSDNGPGMSPAVASQAFEPFFSTKRPGHGTGLGLSMVYGFARQSGGGASIDSSLGEGTTISILLPRSAAGPGVAEPAKRRRDQPGGSETILVVEDEARVRRFAVRCLKDLGYRVLDAENADAALEVMEGGAAVHLLFSDIIMTGGMDGRELARTVARAYPDVKVLLASGFSKAAAAVEQGTTDRPLLKKPYSKDQLASQIREVLDAGDAHR